MTPMVFKWTGSILAQGSEAIWWRVAFNPSASRERAFAKNDWTGGSQANAHRPKAQ